MTDFGGFTLLRCTNCGNDLSGLPSDSIFFCTHCGRCHVSGEKLRQVQISFANHEDPAGILLPFWRVRADIIVHRRVSRTAFRSQFTDGMRSFSEHGRGLYESDENTSRRDVLYFPAFSTNLVLSTGVKLSGVAIETRDPEYGVYRPVIGGSTRAEDVPELARGVAVGIEVARSDHLARVDLDVEVESADIVAMGCHALRHVFSIDSTEITIPLTAVEDSQEILRWWGAEEE